MPSFSLEGKTILITGASSGIGRQCAIDCSKMGAKIILCGRDHSRLSEVNNLLTSHVHLTLTFDLNDDQAFPSLVSEAVAKMGPIHGIVGSAGVSQTLPIRSVSEKHLQHIFSANVKGHYLLIKEGIKKTNFHSNGGSIVLLSSVVAQVGEVAKSAYAMSKGAIAAMSKSMAVELAPRRIRVNTINSGVVKTPLSNASPYAKESESLSKMEEKHLLGFGQSTDISAAAVYLLSDASRWVTGSEMVIDGGYTAI